MLGKAIHQRSVEHAIQVVFPCELVTDILSEGKTTDIEVLIEGVFIDRLAVMLAKLSKA